jgi:hypothetical protein
MACCQAAFTKENLIRDIDAYRDGITKDHVDPFTKISKSEFNSSIDSIKDHAGKCNKDELLVAIMQLNARIEDEHTNIHFDDSNYYPFNVYWFDEGIYVTGTDFAHSKIDLAKVISLNGVAVDALCHKLASLVPGKNNMSIKCRVPDLFNIPGVLHGLGITDSTYELSLMVLTNDGDTVTERFLPKPLRELHVDRPLVEKQLLRNKQKGNYWFNYDSVTKVLYFKYSRCMEEKGKPFGEFEAQLAKEVRKQKPDRIIIDLRYNGGGNSRVLTPFLAWFRGSRYDKKGKAFVLIGRRTFSSAVLASIALSRYTHAILAGEETSGSVNHFGDINFFELPATGLKVSYSTRHIVTNEHYDGTVLPDIRIADKFSDYVKGIDALLDYVSIVQVR